MPNYVKIPREIIYNKDIGDKRVIIFSYLCSRRALDDTVAFSISELCHWSYLKPNFHDGKINQKYLVVLELLSHYGYFVDCPDFEKLAKENLKQASGGDRRSESFEQNQGLPNSVKVENRIDTTKKLAEVAGVGKETYRMGAKILKSDNEDVKKAVLSGEMSINAGYNKIREKQNVNVEDTNYRSNPLTEIFVAVR